MTRAEPNFDKDYAEGAQVEAWVNDVLVPSIATQRAECKLDRGYVDTGNIYVERECWYPARGWQATGIDNPNTARLWLYDLSHSGAVVVFDIDTLRKLADDPRVASPSRCVVGDHPTKGTLLNMRKVFTPGVLERPIR